MDLLTVDRNLSIALSKNHCNESIINEIWGFKDTFSFKVIHIVDLSAAFDLLIPAVFMRKYSNVLSHGLARAISDFLSGRRIVCEVQKIRSKSLDMPLGCVQGSILGPRLFALYMGDLANSIGHQDIIGYADDTYVIINGDSIADVTTKATSISRKHVDYLESLGMVVNKSKTEVMIFGHNQETIIDFAGTMVKTSPNIKALGLTISQDMKWNSHVDLVLSKAQTKLSLLRKIRPVLSMQQFLNIATSQVLSTLYYAAPVWLNTTLGYKHWKKVESMHYRIMRVAINDFKGRRKRKVIDSLCKRATPRMWSDYISASTAIKIIRDNKPRGLADSIEKNMVTERRRDGFGRLFDGSRRRIGLHSFANRLKHLNEIEEPWLDPPPSDDKIRRLLKKHLNFDFSTKT